MPTPPRGAHAEALDGVRRLPRYEGLRFLGAGAFNTAVGGAVFVALQLTLGRVVHYLVVLLLTHVISVLIAFAVHRRMVFGVRGNVLIDLARFETVYLGALGLNLVLLPALVGLAGLPVIPAQFGVVAVTAVVSYLGHKHFSFRRAGAQ